MSFGALRHRNFRLFLFGQLISLSGTWMQQVAIGWLVLQLTDSAFKVGLVTTLGGLPTSLFTLYGGVVADRVRRRRALIVLQSLMLVVALVLAVLTGINRVTVGWIMVLVAGQGLLSAFEVPVRQAFMFEMVGKADLINGIALNSSAFSATRVVGPAIGGIVIASVGVAAVFYLNAASFLAVIVALALMRLPVGVVGPPAGAARAFLDGMRYVWHRPWPRTLIILTGIVSVFGGSFIVMLPVYARDALGVGASGYGATVSAVGVGALAGALFLAGYGPHLRKERLVFRAGMLFGLLLVASALAPRLWLALPLLGATGLAMVLTGVTINTLLQLGAPDELRGRVIGFYVFMALGLAPIGAFQAGWVAQAFGVRTSLALGGTVVLAGAFTLGIHLRRLDPRFQAVHPAALNEPPGAA